MAFKFDRHYLCLGFSHSTTYTQGQCFFRNRSTYTTTEQILHRSASLGAGSQASCFNAAVVGWPLSCCGFATPVSFVMHLFNPLGVRSYCESPAVL